MTKPQTPPTDNREALFEEIGALAWSLKVHSECVERYADLRDFGGIDHALRCLDAALQRAVTLYREIPHARQ